MPNAHGWLALKPLSPLHPAGSAASWRPTRPPMSGKRLLTARKGLLIAGDEAIRLEAIGTSTRNWVSR